MFRLAAVFVALVFAGCVLPDVPSSERPETLVLRYTAVQESADGGGATVGDHCGRAAIRGDRAEIDASDYRGLGPARPFLIVLPDLEGSWATTGTGGFVIGLPGPVRAVLNDDDVTVARVAWVGNATHGHAEVDGKAVPLPHAWTQRNARDGWRIEAELAVGPSRVVTYEPAGPCA